uniref:Uncharacterized protein n=1 Tax=Phenylobacterium glaciei TaxID=2803784 RepID=A0A974P2T7_9CAUL|nr:hypothetical protein JKL49_20955 [Phenylobacterium glaciei]
MPTFNECGNVARLVARLDEVLTGVRWQAIFVDDNSRTERLRRSSAWPTWTVGFTVCIA